MTLIPGVQVPSKIVPSDSLDTYATHQDTYGKGGYRSVADIAERNAITSQRRTEGMLVGVLSDGKIYQLVGGTDNANWQELQTGGGTGMVPPYVTTVNGVSGAVTIVEPDFFLSDAQAMSATLISYTNSASASLQSQISSIPVADIFRSEVASISAGLQAQIEAISASDLSDYTLLSTTATISANLQAQIDSISGGSGTVSTLTSIDGSVVITPISGGYDLSVTPAIISGGSTVFFGSVDLNDTDTEYTINHVSVDTESSIPVVSVESPTNFYRYRIFDRASTSFKVALDATAAATDKILWHLASGTAEIGDCLVTNDGDTLVDNLGNSLVYG